MKAHKEQLKILYENIFFFENDR